MKAVLRTLCWITLFAAVGSTNMGGCFGGGSSRSSVRTWVQWAFGASQLEYPAPRGVHALTFDSARGVTLLQGGWDGVTTYFADTWTWDGLEWTNVSPGGTAGVHHPEGRRGYGMVFDTARGVAVLFGGADD
ncbi:MAG: hypothetical protein ACYTAF_09565, partial [Planctomycetota bacterium]